MSSTTERPHYGRSIGAFARSTRIASVALTTILFCALSGNVFAQTKAIGHLTYVTPHAI